MNNVSGKSEKGRCFCQTTFLIHCRNKIFCTYLEPLVPNSCWKINRAVYFMHVVPCVAETKIFLHDYIALILKDRGSRVGSMTE